MTVWDNALTINNSGSVGYVFYHDYKFVASDHCTVIKVKSDTENPLNKYTGLFLKPVLESMKPKYNFAREISDARLEKEIINLPSKSDGSPNWEMMENFIKSLPYSANI